MSAATWTAVLADDEPHLLAYLGRCLRQAWPELHIVAEASDGEQALAAIVSRRPDVAFLDVRMPGLSGLEVATRAEGLCDIVFVTAYDEHAIEAFEHAAVDYLLKPVTIDRIERTVQRLLARRAARSPDAPSAPALDPLQLQALIEGLRQGLGAPAGAIAVAAGEGAGAAAARRLHWLQVSRGEEVQLLPVAEVDLFQSSDKVTLVLHARGEWVIRTPLRDLEPQLDPDLFWRVHRNAIVRVAAISAIERDLQGQFVLRLGEAGRRVAVSRPYAHRFKAL